MTFEISDVYDVSSITKLINSAYQHEEKWKKTARTNESEVLRIINKDGTILFKAVVDELIVACATLTLNKSSATFGMLSVSPKDHGQGLGYQTILFLEAEAAKRGYKCMECEVASFNTHLVSYYERLGYRWFASNPWDEPSLKIANVTFEQYRKALK